MLHPRKFLKQVGPGVITGASDDDPSGIVTYAQAGAQFGNGLLWLALFTTPMMMAIQEMSARLGVVTRRGLNALIRSHVSRTAALVLSTILLVVNVVNIAADISAMSAIMHLFLPLPTWIFVLVFVGIFIEIELTASYARSVNFLKWLTLSLLTYVVAGFVIRNDWTAIFQSAVVPMIPAGANVWPMITAILGTTISPYLFFWQASEEAEVEKRGHPGSPETTRKHLRRMRFDTATGMIFSNVVMFFIILVSAGTLHLHGITTVTTAAEAAEALRPIAGSFSFLLFGLGLIGTGLLAVPVLAASAAYATAEVFGWREGLGKGLHRAKGFTVTMLVVVLAGGLMTASGISPIWFLILAAILNGLAAPVIIFFVRRLADDPGVVGEHRSPRIVSTAAWVTLLVMSLAGIMTIWNILV